MLITLIIVLAIIYSGRCGKCRKHFEKTAAIEMEAMLASIGSETAFIACVPEQDMK